MLELYGCVLLPGQLRSVSTYGWLFVDNKRECK